MGPLYCSACGRRLGAGDRFCTACGAHVPPAQSDPAPTAVRRPLAAAQPSAATPRRARARKRWWAVGVLAAVVVAGTSYGLGTLETRAGDNRIGDRHAATSLDAVRSPAAGLHGPGTIPSVSPTIAPQALAQARALRALLVHSAADKQAIAGAVAQLFTCRHLAAGIATFEDAAASRDRLLDQAAELQVGLLPGGGAAIASFSQALRAAAEADRAYVAWGQARHKVHDQCRGGRSLRLQAVRLSSASHEPKQRTAAAWNLIATQLGLPQISWTIL